MSHQSMWNEYDIGNLQTTKCAELKFGIGNSEGCYFIKL